MEVRAVLVAASLGADDLQLLESNAVEVHVLPRRRIADLTDAALEVRKRHPRLPLIVSAPERLLGRFERRYPSLVDVSIPNATANLVLATLIPNP